MRGRGSLQFRLPHPHRSLMTAWKTTQAPCGKKTKAELREMLAEAVRNTQSRELEVCAAAGLMTTAVPMIRL